MGVNAPEPFQLSEIHAFCLLRGIVSLSLRAKYLRVLQRLDRVFLDHWAEHNKNNK